jgi:hypothetical protein
LIKITFWVLASSPPILGAFFVKELVVITSYAGVLAIVTTLTFPSLLYLTCQHEMEQRDEFGETYYDGWGSCNHGAYTVLLISIVTTLYILTTLLFSDNAG